MDLKEYRGKCGSCEHWLGSRDCTLKKVKKSSHETCDEYQESNKHEEFKTFKFDSSYLTNKHVIIKAEVVNQDMSKNVAKRVFKCESGSGIYPFTMGDGLFGNWIFDGEYDKLRRQFVSRYATEQEIKDATHIFTQNIDKEKQKTNPALKK